MQPTYLDRPDSALTAPGTSALQEAALMRFGVSLGNADVLLPSGMAAEFIAEPEIFPVPRAPKGLVGMVQLRGAPVAVFAAGVQFDPNALSTGRNANRPGVLVLGTQGQYGAVLVPKPPVSVNLTNAVSGKAFLKAATAHDTVGVTPWLVPAIRYRVTDASGIHWWELDLGELMQALAASGPSFH
jgi:hypothetical protein